jgi:hypothetical protein
MLEISDICYAAIHTASVCLFGLYVTSRKSASDGRVEGKMKRAQHTGNDATCREATSIDG